MSLKLLFKTEKLTTRYRLPKDEYPFLNLELCKSVGLQQFYPFRLMKRTRHTETYGVATHSGLIYLICEMREKSAIFMYLHEIAHVISRKYNVSKNHDEYFGTLVCIMYRRHPESDYLMRSISMYDFGDRAGSRNGLSARPPDSELIRRFAFILRKSSELAVSKLSIEECAIQLKSELDGLQKAPTPVLRNKNTQIANYLGMGLTVILFAGVAMSIFFG